ncbi:MAG: tetratricopeptide repeat protein [bacterium]
MKDRDGVETNIRKGKEALERGDFNGARLRYETAVSIDDTNGEAHRGLGEVHLATGENAAAKRCLRKAIEIERKKLGSVAAGAHDWWNDPKTQTFLKAKEALGIVYWDEGKFDAAIREFRDVLRKDPDDNQGVRARIPSLLMLKGDIKAALKEFSACEKAANNGLEDPHLLYNSALAHFAAGDSASATGALRRAVFSNIYIPSLTLMCASPPTDIYLPHNFATPEYALSYFSGYNHLWQKQPGSISFLDKTWNSREITDAITQYIQVMHDVLTTESARRKKHLIAVAARIRLKPATGKLVGIMTKARESGEFTAEADSNLITQREDEIMNLPVCPVDGGGIPCAPEKFLELLYGLLYYEGALEIRDVFEYLCEGLGYSPGITVRELFELMEQNSRFHLDIPDAVYRKEVEEPERCLQMKEIYRPTDVPDYYLEDLERAAANAVPPTKEEKTLIVALRNVGHPTSLDEIRFHIRNCDITRVIKRLGLHTLPRSSRNVIETLVKKSLDDHPPLRAVGLHPLRHGQGKPRGREEEQTPLTPAGNLAKVQKFKSSRFVI